MMHPQLRIPQIHRMTLDFKDSSIEREFKHQNTIKSKQQIRLFVMFIICTMSFFSILDYLYIQNTGLSNISYRYIASILFLLIAFTLTANKFFIQFKELILFSLVMLCANIFLMRMLDIPSELKSFFFIGIVLLGLGYQCLSVIRFPYAVSFSLILIILFNFKFRDLPIFNLMHDNFILVATSLIGIVTSYRLEMSNRVTFLKEKMGGSSLTRAAKAVLYDDMIGLANRNLLYDRIEQTIYYSQRHEQICAGILIEIESLNRIYERYNQELQDKVLMETAKRFREVSRDSDTLAYLGDGKFFILAIDVKNYDDTENLVSKLINQLKLPINIIDDQRFTISKISLGICLFPYKDATSVDIVSRAESEMSERFV